MSKKIELDQKELILKYEEFKSITKTAIYFNVSKNVVYRRLKECNATLPPLNKRVNLEQLITAFEKHKSYLGAANEVGLSEACARKHLKANNYISSKRQFGALKNHIDVEIFNCIDTPEKAYWLGFIAADGCVYQIKNGYMFQINLSINDKDHLEKFKAFLDTSYAVTEKSRVCTIQIPSKRFCENLIKNSIVPRKSKTYEMPIINNNLTSHFVRGYFDGDGCIAYNEKRNEFSFDLVTGSKTFFNQLKEILPFNTHSRIKGDKKYPNSEYYYLRVGHKDEILKAYNWLYKDASVFLERKHECFSKIKSCRRIR